MRKISLYSLLAMSVMMFACNDSDDTIDPGSSDKVILNVTGQESRISTEGAGVVEKQGLGEMPENFFSTESYVSKSALVEGEEASDLPLVLVAEVAAPEYEGTTLQATHVCFDGNYAYVAYNVKGAAYLGAVDVIDITDPTMPQLAMNATIPGVDVSSIAIQDGVLYLAGAQDVDLTEGVVNPAVLIKMNLDGAMLSDDVTFIELTSYVATDVVADGNFVYTVSGDAGSLLAVDATNDEILSRVDIADLRAVGIDGDRLVVLSGETGINIFSRNTFTALSDFPVSEDVAGAKRTIDFYDNHVLVAEGFDGMGVYSLEDGANALTIPVVTNASVSPNELVCNAVTVTDDHIFLAEGAGGVVVYSMVDGGLTNPTEIGGLDLEGSANYVESGDDYIFVADGTGGLKILKIFKAETGEDPESENPEYACATYPAFTGNGWLNVNSNDSQAYSGSASLGGINVNAQLIWCGSVAVSQHINVNSNGEFVMIGSLVTGQKKNGNANSGSSLVVNNKMIVEGALTVYGGLIVNSGGSLEFVGDNSSIYVDGTVNVNGSGEIIGQFQDLSGNVK